MDMDGWPGDQMSGQEPLGLGDATTALAELADLAELEDTLRQDYPGARLDDVDEEAVRRALGRQAVDDMEALRQIERELERQGYLERSDGKLELTPKAVRRLGETALRRFFDLPRRSRGSTSAMPGRPGGHRSTRPWHFGDEQAIDTAATVRNALLRGYRQRTLAAAGGPGAGCGRRGECGAGRAPGGPRVRLSVQDFEVGERSAGGGRRLVAGRLVLLDEARHLERGRRRRWRCMRWSTRHRRTRSRSSGSLTTRASCARPIRRLGWDMVQGTNLHHALVLAGRYRPAP